MGKKIYTMGSLFDGIGGFVLAGSFYGIRTLWASEIVPTAIAITKRHFPDMKHVGDITKLNGAELEPVDIITFGSPCQDLSIASGVRLGLDGSRSGLFMEAIRIIREMRVATNGKYPRFIVWENVPGAASSSGGRDFCKVLSEITQAEIPMPDNNKWANAGMVIFDGVSLAYRQLDAQFWGLAQRRKRFFLVADFIGQSAGEILFKPEGLYRYLTPGGTPWEGIADYAQGCACDAVTIVNDQGGDSINIEKDGISPTLRSETHGNLLVVTMRIRQGCDGGGKGALLQTEKSGTLATGNDQILFASDDKATGVLQYQNGQVIETDIAFTLTTTSTASARNATLVAHPKICATLCASASGLSRPGGMGSESDLCIVQAVDPEICACGFDMQNTNNANHSHLKEVQPVLCVSDLSHVAIKNTPNDQIAYCLQGSMIGREDKNGPNGDGINENISFCLNTCDRHAVSAVDCRNFSENEEICGTLQSKATGGYALNSQNPVRTGYIVRRLVPRECERLMGFPDDWTAYGHDGKAISDTARYQALGNSVAVPCVAYIMAGIYEQLNKGMEEHT